MDVDHNVAVAADEAELNPKRLSRRSLLRRVSFAGAGVVLVPLLTACGGGDDEDEGEEQEEQEENGEEQEEGDV